MQQEGARAPAARRRSDWPATSRSHETVRIDVDLQPDAVRRIDACKPVTNDRLHLHVARRLEQQASAMATAQDGQRGGRWSEHLYIAAVRLAEILQDTPFV